jgi:uncharacterized protein (AIM24 family)
MQHRILGSVFQVVELTLDAEETVTSVAGELSWMSANVQMQKSTHMNNSADGQGSYGWSKGWAPLIYAEYTALNGPGMVAFSAKLPGHIIEVPVLPGETYQVHRDGFLCGTSDIIVTTPFTQNMATGGLGGNGLFLRTIGGVGTAFVELHGELVSYDLAAGQSLKVRPGNIGMLSSSVTTELIRIPGIRVDNIFLAKVTGPGKIWLHSMPLANLATALAPLMATTR